jgi:RimJ/RimL family protein N-acetyltransferase
VTPILKTPRLTLAPPFMHEGMDVSHYLKWLCNESVTKFSEQRHRTHTAESQYEYLSSFTGDNQIWEIQRGPTPIGTITAYRNPPNRTANIGILIGEPRVWGEGYGPEAWEAVCNYLFEDGIRKLEAGCMASNNSMIKVLNKTGFNLEATLPNYFLLNGKPEDLKYYGRYREAKILPLTKEKEIIYRR